MCMIQIVFMNLFQKLVMKKQKHLMKQIATLLNTCHIRDKAKEKVYHEIGRVKKNFKLKEKPDCY